VEGRFEEETTMSKKMSMKLGLAILLSVCTLSVFAQSNDEAFFRYCAAGAINDVRSIAAAGANINAWGEVKDADGYSSWYTCLMIACKNENVDVVDFLLDQGARPNPHSREYPIHYVVNWQRVDLQTTARIIRKFHAKGADINARTTSGLTPLLLSAQDPRKQDISLLLLELGADVNVRDGDARTPLLVALNAGQVNTLQHRLIEKLIESGANTSAKDSQGNDAYAIVQKYDRQKINEISYYTWYWTIRDNYFNTL
jgi:ankyrin repeat protein